MSKKGHGHHGGSWKVAYADFVTAMMALFLCLWLTAQDTKIKDAVERAFRNPFSSVTKESTGIIPNKDASATYKQAGKFDSISAVEMETMRHVSDDLTRLLQKQNELESSVQIDLTPDGLRINIFDRSHKPIFEPGTDKFTDYGAWVFSTLAWEISRYKTFRIELEGHTETSNEEDTQTLGKWDLSTDRANAARRKVVQSGVDAVQICKVSGFADTVPMPDMPPDAEINRRVTVLLKLRESMNALPTAETASTGSQTNDTHPN
ncbi:MAG TPA: flagellar motor protein MotB [Candidatus Polarisedimenticolia bacterium]|nr:flagellar motor protein MotB [Candidatus Polarisedimenticolia bacterium]